jgi:cell fate regulator YaaT (PSP1 superfamily)
MNGILPVTESQEFEDENYKLKARLYEMSNERVTDKTLIDSLTKQINSLRVGKY